jgi:UDP-N-acetylmuramoyl-tripeptide--D-alanyl-D-alanine ligase
LNEIGPDAPDHHAEVGRAAAEAGVQYLIGVGDANAGQIVTAAQAGGVQTAHVPDAATALALIRTQWQPGDVVLVKGSNDTGLQSLARSPTTRSGR